jgi:Ribbon-Helix-Helix transcriptional regulator family
LDGAEPPLPKAFGGSLRRAGAASDQSPSARADARMAAMVVQELRLKGSDSEKITINPGYVDLGHVDLMVQEG